ncbi:unnamed protein product [Miscanthus lutarioriparius]|uniref:Uncharacterized protein n=1 Tax=Miscanthus lutarioriparius TaxID=422564 RepID=A0A811NBK6_9POAL|nr:unnamed protein product [Miscanthus lutarioriparius]
MDDSVLELPAAMDARVALTPTSATGSNHSGTAQPCPRSAPAATCVGRARQAAPAYQRRASCALPTRTPSPGYERRTGLGCFAERHRAVAAADDEQQRRPRPWPRRLRRRSAGRATSSKARSQAPPAARLSLALAARRRAALAAAPAPRAPSAALHGVRGRAARRQEKHNNFNSGLPMVGSCIRNNYYVPKWHKKDSKEHAPCLEILAFPCNQFAGQEPGSNEYVKAKFPIFDKDKWNCGTNQTNPRQRYSQRLGEWSLWSQACLQS